MTEDETPVDINELYNRNPLDLEDDDIRSIIADQRKRRKSFNLGNLKAGNTKAKPPNKAKQQVNDLASTLKLDI